MTDAHLDPVLDLSPKTLLECCQGCVKRLPSFVVHDDAAWPWFNKVRPAKGKIHIRRSTFNRIVTTQVPVRPGMWLGPDRQEFFIDLLPHQLQGASDQAARQPGATNHNTARRVACADEAGRLPDEEGHGTPIVERSAVRDDQRADIERLARDGKARGVRSSVFSGSGSTERDVAMGDDD